MCRDVKSVQKLIVPEAKFSNEPFTHQQLIKAQQADKTLAHTFVAAQKSRIGYCVSDTDPQSL